MDKKRYTIDELTELTGFTRRTIRYYIAEGLLDPPAGRGRGGFYYDSHLTTLRQIATYQEQGYGLAAIRELLEKEPVPEITQKRAVWVRVDIVPGLELHMSRSLEEKEQRTILEIIRIAKTLMKTGGTDNE